MGYINGLAIGKKNRNRNDMDWEEINAGLGHLFVLFCFLVMKFEYQCVRLVDRECLGSCSKAKVGNRVYEMYVTSDSARTARTGRRSSVNCWTNGCWSWSC